VLHKLGPNTLDTLVETLREDSDYRLRSTVSRTFYLHGMPIFPRLRKMLTDDSHDVRFVAADVMYDLLVRSGTQIPKGLFPELLTAATDKNVQVRQQVFSLLRMFPDRIDEMFTLLERVVGEDPDVTTRTRAISAVGHGVIKLDKSNPTYPKCVKVLCRASEKDSSFYVRELTIYYLEKLAAKDKQALRALVRATGDETASTRRKAAAALKKLGHPIEGK
jgi:HEAT repeat protein